MAQAPNFTGFTYFIHAFGCQMNKSDSERVCGSLDALGALQVDDVESADIVILLTCCVREAADTRLFGQLDSMKNVPLRRNSPVNKRIFVIGGCIAQRDGELLLSKFNHVDVVIGTQIISKLPSLIQDAVDNGARSVETPEKSDEFATDLPATREKVYSAWLPITSGCDNFCTYCIVPYVRGREKSREVKDILDEANSLVSQGVKEITLLGQNVNSYGRDLYGEPKFYEILQGVADTGIKRLRFVTSHPKDLNDRVIQLFGKLDNLMPAIHLPVQSGSDDILKKMNRKYDTSRYLDLIYKLKDARDDIAISTDIIVGFPGETESDFQGTLDIVDLVKYASAFTFIYSKREGTPAAKIEDSTPRSEIEERYKRLTDKVAYYANEYNQQFSDKTLPALIEDTSKKDPSILRGISDFNQVVHAKIPENKTIEDLRGEILPIKIDECKTWYLSGNIV